MVQRCLQRETGVARRIPIFRSVMTRAVLMCLVAGWAAVGRAQTSENAAPRFVVTKYTIDADLFPSTHTLTAKANIELTPNSDLTTLSFQLNASLRVEKILDASGQQISFKQDGQSLALSLMNPLPGGKSASLTVNYGGTLSTADGSPVENLKLAYVGPEGSYLLYPGHWFPVSPNDLNRFAATMRIGVPSEETVIASGKPLAPARGTGRVTYGFEYDQASFPGTVLAGKYVVQPAALTGADIVFYMKPGHEQYVSSYGETAGKILSYYSDKFGPLPSSHLAIVEIEDGTVGGYTSPGIVALATRAFSTPVNYRLLAHEISHQWWRCLVSPATPNDAYLDEGLATYSAALFVEDTAGQAAFEDLMHEVEVGALTHESVAPIAQASHLQPFTPEYQSIVFQKGAMVFHMLRWVLGDENFFKALKALTKQYAGKSVTGDEFQKLAEATSKQELTYFFAQWVNSTGVPQFKRTWSIYRTQKGYQVVGKLQQDLDLFRMPVEVRVECEGSRPVNQRVDMVGTTSDFTVNTRTKPLRVIIDPASRLLKYDDTIKFQVEMARADQLAQQQAYLEAIKQYQAVLELNKNSSLAHYRLGETFFKLRNYNAAMEEFRRTLDGDLKPKWVEVWSHLMLGKIFDVTGQRDRAINEYQRALQTNDNTQGALDEANRYIQKAYTQQSG